MPETALQSKTSEDDECDYDDDIEEGCEDDVLDNVSKNSTPTSFSCYPSTSLSDSKLRTDDSATHCNPLRKRNTVKSTKTKATKSKCVQFVTTNELYSKPLKKIVFNGTFPIDVPYSSRF